MNNQHAAAAAQQLAVFPELAGLLPGFNPNAGVGGGSPAGLTGLTGAGGLDQATLLAQLNNANLASLIGGNSLRHGGGSGANGMNRFGVTNLLPTSLPVSVASQNAFLQASGLQSPAADAGLLYAAAAGYDPQSMIQLGLLSANSPVASQSDIGAGAAGSSESSFGEFKSKNMPMVAFPRSLLIQTI